MTNARLSQNVFPFGGSARRPGAFPSKEHAAAGLPPAAAANVFSILDE